MNTIADEDYLKAIYTLGLVQPVVSTSAVAEYMGYSAATVTEMFQKLAKREWVIYAPYQGVTLTPSGERMAKAVLRRHRLLETFLVTVLGVPWDKVHCEAENLEHAISDDLMDRMDEYLGHPSSDPHGAPIPSRSGELPLTTSFPLRDGQFGQTVEITQVIDRDVNTLIELERIGAKPGKKIVIISNPFHEQSVRFTRDDHEYALNNEMANRVFVRLVEKKNLRHKNI